MHTTNDITKAKNLNDLHISLDLHDFSSEYDGAINNITFDECVPMIDNRQTSLREQALMVSQLSS
jgi:hypothetical protein